MARKSRMIQNIKNSTNVRMRVIPVSGSIITHKSTSPLVYAQDFMPSDHNAVGRIFDNLPVCIASLDRYGNYIEVNRAFARLFNQKPEFFQGKNAFDLDPSPDSRALFERVIGQGLPTTSYNIPYSDPEHPERGTAWWDWTLYPDISQDGEITGVIFLAQDVTARYKTEQALEHSHALFELIFETAPDANVLVDESGMILTVNRRMEEIFGYARGELIGKMVEVLIPDRFCENHIVDRLAYAAKPKARPMGEGQELKARHSSGREIPVQISLNPIQTENGLRILATIHDLSAAKAAQQNLRDSQARLQAIFDNAPVGIQLLDEAGNIITTNRVMQAMLGYSNEELQRMNFLGFTFEEDWVVNLNKLQQLLRREINSFHLEKRYRRKDGSLFWGRLNVSRYDHEDNDLHYLIAMVENINDYKESETARKNSEARFRASVESMLAGFAILASIRDENHQIIDFRYEFINEAGCRINRLSREQHLGQSLLTLSPHVAQSDLVEQYKTMITTGEPLAIEWITPRDETGDERFFDIQAAPLGDGIAVWWSDTTPRIIAEKVVRRQEELLRTVIENLPVGLWITDQNGVVQYTNRTGREIWGGVSLAGQSWHEVIEGCWAASGVPIKPQEWGVYRAVTQGETSIEEEVTILAPTGESKELLVSAAPIWDEDLRITGAVIINQDITERVQMQAELAEVQRKLLSQAEEERLHLSRELHDGPMQDLYGVSFRLNDLVTRLSDETDQEIATQTRADLQNAVASLRGLMSALRPPTLTPFGLEKTIRSHAEEFKEKHPELSLQLDLARDGQALPEPVRLALFRIYQESLNNILRHASASQVTVRFKYTRDQAEILISDNGIGFKAPDHWVELARGGHYGLVGMRERAEALGGSFELCSRPGKGTRFHAVVPLTRK